MSNGTNMNPVSADWLETEDPNREGAFLEDALTEADADSSKDIPVDNLPEEERD